MTQETRKKGEFAKFTMRREGEKGKYSASLECGGIEGPDDIMNMCMLMIDAAVTYITEGNRANGIQIDKPAVARALRDNYIRNLDTDKAPTSDVYPSDKTGHLS